MFYKLNDADVTKHDPKTALEKYKIIKKKVRIDSSIFGLQDYKKKKKKK